MNDLFQLRLTPKSSFMTPLHADTLWGHLAWYVFLTQGEERGRQFIEAFKENPPFVLSDAFPEEYLPKPFLKIEHEAPLSKSEQINNIRIAKKLKTESLIHREGYGGDPQKWQYPKSSTKTHEETILKNIISRQTNSTEEGGIFDQTEYFFSGEYLSVYFRVFDRGFWNDWNIERLYTDIFENIGYGQKKSTGKGFFETTWNHAFDFSIQSSLGQSVLLSHCLLTQSQYDLLDTALYRTKTKYGKLGESKVFIENPFKNPLVQLIPGSTFETKDPFIGMMTQSIKTNSDIWDYQYGFLLSF